MTHLVIPKILIVSLIVALERSSAQINLDYFKTQTDSNNVNDGLKLTDPPKEG